MGKDNINAISSQGNFFTSASSASTETSRLKSFNSGYSNKDTVSSAKRAEDSDSCCPAADRLSNWFSGLSCIGQTFFILGSILSVGIIALGALAYFACVDD